MECCLYAAEWLEYGLSDNEISSTGMCQTKVFRGVCVYKKHRKFKESRKNESERSCRFVQDVSWRFDSKTKFSGTF